MERILLHIIPAIAIGFIVQIVLHEIGHLIGGLLTGWRFLYMQLYTLVLKRDNKGLKLVVVRDKGFKCIMYPISINSKALLYTMGGCISNLIVSVIGLAIMILFPLSPVLWLYIWCFLAFGIGLYFMNGTASFKRICNDKACYILLRTDSHNRLCHNAQFIIAKHLVEGLSYREIGEEIICLSPDIAQSDIQAYQAVLEYYYHLDNKNILKVGQAINKIRNKDNISGEVSNIIELEHVYLQLLTAFILFDSGHSNISINNVGDNLNLYCKRGDLHSLRVMAVYEAYVKLSIGDSNKAIEHLNTTIENMKRINCVYEGEKIFCINQLSGIINIIEGYQNNDNCNYEVDKLCEV